jgi:hypothetical protein
MILGFVAGLVGAIAGIGGGERDWRYGAVSFGVLTILLLGAAFGIGEH